jgi:hypothetical protein
MTSGPRGKPPSTGALASDPPVWRFAFFVLHGHRAPYWLTLWLVLILVTLVGLGAVVGPWAPGAMAGIAAFTAGGRAIASRRAADRSIASQDTS